VGSDFSEAMLERARAKVQARGADAVFPRFVWADAMALPCANDSFDAATVGFGVRNFDDLALGLREMVRVVRPGGAVVVLEITTPTRPVLSLFYRVWFDRIVPLLGRLAGAGVALAARLGRSAPGGEIADAYTYLPSSVRRFPPPAALAVEMQRAGLSDVRYVLMAGGIVAVHAGTVRPQQA
jgi:demethylmenaquinone methyltransferase / 2-methoxy-6-polyprenyl-1,4-benzoquinol methylase